MRQLGGKQLALLLVTGLTLAGLFVGARLASAVGLRRANPAVIGKAAGRLLLQEPAQAPLLLEPGRLPLDDFVVALPTDDKHLEVINV